MADEQQPSRIQRPTKRLNRFYKAANRLRNLAARAAAGSDWRGVENPPAPHKPRF